MITTCRDSNDLAFSSSLLNNAGHPPRYAESDPAECWRQVRRQHECAPDGYLAYLLQQFGNPFMMLPLEYRPNVREAIYRGSQPAAHEPGQSGISLPDKCYYVKDVNRMVSPRHHSEIGIKFL